MRAGDALGSFEGADDELVGVGFFAGGHGAVQLFVVQALTLTHRRPRQ